MRLSKSRSTLEWLMWLVAAICLASLPVHAQSRDVTEAAKREILRRGAHMEMTGTIQAGQFIAAVETPEDDSGKWHICLIGQRGETAFEQMKTMIESGKNERLLAWIDATNPKLAFAWFTTRGISDVSQQDWLQGLESVVGKYGVPAVVIQPPRSGRFGKPTTIVKMIHGRHTADELADLIRDGIQHYLQTTQTPVRNGGVTNGPGRVDPPFNVPQQPMPVAPNPPNPFSAPTNTVPFDWPPSPPKPLTIDQIKTACPDASPEFILENMAETDINKVQLKWMIAQRDRRKDAVPTAIEDVPPGPAVNPLVPATLPPLSVLAMVSCGAFLMALVSLKAWTWLGGKIADIRTTCDRVIAIAQSQESSTSSPSTEPTAASSGNAKWQPPGPKGNG